MSIPLAQIRSGIYNWIKEELKDSPVGPERIIWLKQEGPRPPRPYVGLDLVSGPSQVGHDEHRATAIPGVVNTTGNRRITVSVDVYGKDSDALIMKLHTSLEKQTVQALLTASGLSLVRQEDVNDLSAVIDTRFESRYQFDVIFGCVSAVEDNVGLIETVRLKNLDTDEEQIIGP